MKGLDILDLLGVKKQKFIDEGRDSSIKLRNITNLKEKLNPLIPSHKSIEFTKYNEPVLLVKPINLSEDLLIFRLYNGVNRFQLNLINDKSILKIADLQVLQENEFRKGYGTFLIQEAIKLAKSQNKLKICGFMSYDNEKHHQRQISFYKKSGFTILEDNYHFEMVLS